MRLTMMTKILTSVVFTAVLPHRTSDGGAYGEFSYGEHPIDRPASFTKKVIKHFADRIKVKIEDIGDLLNVTKKRFKGFGARGAISGSGQTKPVSGISLVEAESGKGDVKPKAGDALTTPKAGKGNIRIKKDP